MESKEVFYCDNCKKEIKRDELNTHRNKNPYHKVFCIYKIKVFELPKRMTLQLKDSRNLEEGELINQYKANYKQANFPILIFKAPYIELYNYECEYQYIVKEKDLQIIEKWLNEAKKAITEDDKRKEIAHNK